MAQKLTEPLRSRHDSLRPRVEQIAEVAGEFPSLRLDERRAAVAEILDFLRGELALHAEAEETWLYPQIARQLSHPLATAGMAFDHKLLREWIEELEGTDVHDASTLQALLYSIHALLDAHFRKEEEVYLPLLEYEDKASTIVAIEAAMGRYERGEVAVAARAEIDLERHEFPSRGHPIEKLAYLLRYAIKAPSSHNSQPWRFRLVDDSVELFADRSRALPVVDPDDRELLMSCGAALFTFRVAIRHHAFEDEVELMPDGGESDLLARIGSASREPPRAPRSSYSGQSPRATRIVTRSRRGPSPTSCSPSWSAQPTTRARSSRYSRPTKSAAGSEPSSPKATSDSSQIRGSGASSPPGCTPGDARCGMA